MGRYTRKKTAPVTISPNLVHDYTDIAVIT